MHTLSGVESSSPDQRFHGLVRSAKSCYFILCLPHPSNEQLNDNLPAEVVRACVRKRNLGRCLRHPLSSGQGDTCALGADGDLDHLDLLFYEMLGCRPYPGKTCSRFCSALDYAEVPRLPSLPPTRKHVVDTIQTDQEPNLPCVADLGHDWPTFEHLSCRTLLHCKVQVDIIRLHPVSGRSTIFK